MNTKIVFRLYKLFVKNGFSTIRFNFRGVGKSDGLFDDGEGELSDAAGVLDWLQQYNTNSKICWVAGFCPRWGACIFSYADGWIHLRICCGRLCHRHDCSCVARTVWADCLGKQGRDSTFRAH